MTEEEARTKWCPQTRYVIDIPDTAYIGNRFEGSANSECKCIASDCMMWVDASYMNDIRTKKIEDGHCGLVNP